MHAIDPILEIGERHHGLVLATEARTAGLTRAALRHRVKTGQLRPVGARVLRVAGAPRSDLQAVLAAVLDASPGAFASGHTAAALWAVPGYRLSPVHVVRPRGVSGRRTGVADVLHTIAGLRPAHVTVLDQVPVLRPEVVVLQLCASDHAARAERALDNLWRRRLLSGPSVRRALNELAIQGRGGVCLLRELLDRRGDDYVPAASNLERRFEAVLEGAGEPPMRRQVDSGGDHWVGRVDFRDADLPLIVEVQSEHFHSALVDREHDARRLAALSEAGFVVVEVSEEQVWHRPAEVVEAVRSARRRLSSTSRARIGRSNNHSGRENASAAAVTLPAWTRQARSSHAMPITPRPV